MRILIASLLFFFLSNCSSPHDQDSVLADIMEHSLKSVLLDAWYPTVIDTVHGGYLTDFSYDWQSAGPHNKMLVSQARHVWTLSTAGLFLNEPLYIKYAKHGVQFLTDKMWDDEFGGFYVIRDRQGNETNGGFASSKTAYSNAFAIYGLAAYFKASGDSSTLHTAQQTFYWLEEHSHDAQYKGYVDNLNRDGSWLVTPPIKDFNSSIHLLEAFKSLYEVWPDSLVRERLAEMHSLVRDTFIGDKGYLTLFFHQDWQKRIDNQSRDAIAKEFYDCNHVSFGHDVETAFLLMESSHALGLHNDAQTLTIAKQLVDHSLATGWDAETSSFYEAGYYFKPDSLTIVSKEKLWWGEAEAMNALLLMHRLFPNEPKYENAFIGLWNYNNQYLIDHEHGGWYSAGLDENPRAAKRHKAHMWKANYHTARAMMSCIEQLRESH